MKSKMLIICGPTASGKTLLAVECAKRLNSEIISADSMNVYRGLSIGTAKPTEHEKCGMVHHLIDVVSPRETFSVGDYKELAEPIVKDIINRGKIPIICGGTGFYINSLLYDMSYGLGKDNANVREKYKQLAAEKGNEYVYAILKEKDTLSAEKIHCNDLKRVIRALEICENGVKKSDIKDEMTPKYDYLAITPLIGREELYKKIDARVDKMIENGLIEEVKGLLAQGIDGSFQCMQGIGYKEVIPYLNGEKSLQETAAAIKLNTRHYAKRQVTFFKKLNGLEVAPYKDMEKAADYIAERLE